MFWIQFSMINDQTIRLKPWGFVLLVVLNFSGQTLSSSRLSSRLTTTTDKCSKITASNPMIINQIDLSPFIACSSDIVSVRLSQINIDGFHKMKVESYHGYSQDPSGMGEKTANITVPKLEFYGTYKAKGTLGQMFPVHGSGTVKVQFDNVSVRLAVPEKSKHYMTGDKREEIMWFLQDVHLTSPKMIFKDNHVSKDEEQGTESSQPAMGGDQFFRDSMAKTMFWQMFTRLDDNSPVWQQIDCILSEHETSLPTLANSPKKIRSRLSRPARSPILPLDQLNERPIRQTRSTSDENLAVTGLQDPNTGVFPIDPVEKTVDYWHKSAARDIEKAANRKKNDKIAKNLILFIGDGMGISTLTAARILKGQLHGKPDAKRLQFEEFPYSSLIRTFNLDKHVPDSAATASAFMSGVKANYKTLGVNGRITSTERNCSLINENKVETLMTWAQKAGKGTGIVSTMRITHATPAASYAHVPHRWWEADSNIKKDKIKPFGEDECKDIARQLIEDSPGNQFNVILGGGRRNFLPINTPDEDECNRTDSLNLIEKWKEAKKETKKEYAYVDSSGALKAIDYDNTDYVLGLFNSSHMPYESSRDKSHQGPPSLSEMTEASLKILQKHENGYVLFVEGGLIDWYHHSNQPAISLHEVLELEKTIQNTVDSVSLEDTMIVVTADHSHGFVINGYASRNKSIFGFSDEKEEGTKEPFTTLMYTTGPGKPRGKGNSDDPDLYQITTRRYSAINLNDSVHGGEDVALYSTGPNAHLFTGLQDQTIIPHVMAYSACIGPFSNTKRCLMFNEGRSSAPGLMSSSFFIIFNLISITLWYARKFHKM
ncbi:alkaline phosphatase-like [Brevipalpus obovatus]|uniref:alkaline phosphatase-like n=1 Tax=Brevipalpus obovatus TaxID=246614 RepID=UPI003D9F518F